MKICIREEILTDGSKVFNVHLIDDNARVVFHMIGEMSANQFAVELRQMLTKYTVDALPEDGDEWIHRGTGNCGPRSMFNR